MTPQGWMLLLASAILTTAANLLMRAGVVKAGGMPSDFSAIPRALLALAGQPLFDIGAAFYVLASLIWFRIIATEPLSTAYPLLVAQTFILITLGAVLIFHETVGLAKVAGILVILVGIFIVSRG